MGWESIELPDAEIALDRAWLPEPEADALFQALLDTVPWQVHRIRLFGREVDSPRLSCWIGDPDASYRYSGRRYEPHPWPPALEPVRERLSVACGAGFNGVLANLYRDGRDAMGWHRDDERDLGPQPVIASLSLGAARRFLLKKTSGVRTPHRPRAGSEKKSGRPPDAALELGHGSLLVMRGATQCNYRHALPRTRKPVGPRINLTFRQVLN
ncbi:alpha-ketoglutarate-dependent dioxygenase AlkB [Luteimonas vadosa]|uniref:Alpha-ketoglutarate-dependent dioxygenase AlkB n=1 Tax=Luteimonas vadosa TaxID=1165507 RepID=A0ABP9DR67_9GAMM